MSYNGIINVYKESGYTSHDVVAVLRGIFKQKKIGHTGTLDPLAVGVLPVCLGSGTKLCEFLTDKDKEYKAVLRLGMTTDTQDLSGRIISEQKVLVTEEEVCSALNSFRGRIMQVPPMFSALKVDGKKLYELARDGKEVERKPRPAEIKELEILRMDLPDIEFRLVCSKGTYVRTVCHDAGVLLGTGGAMKALERTRSGEFLQADALTLAEIGELMKADKITGVIKPVDSIFDQLTKVVVKDEYLKPVKNGNKLRSFTVLCQNKVLDGEEVRVYGEDSCFYGIYQYQEKEAAYRPVKMFL
ncbi:MAG: tRNA pseudouridine(55) synthase TruB [Lachnospiraceae bacterium]|nr:tRNA pseudouridine(55) synthase TruB [Lachnospiraceae bacterium]